MARAVAFEKRRYTPNSGDTIVWEYGLDDVFITIDNPAVLATLTIQLPPAPEEGMLFMVSVRSAITQIVFTSNGVPLRNLVSRLDGGGVIGWYYDQVAGSWFTYLPSPITTYAIAVQALTSSPADGATTYFGTVPRAPIANPAASKIFIRKAGTIKIVEIYCISGTAGSGEAWSLYIRKNNTTDFLIATVAQANNERIFTNSNIGIPMAAGDYFEIKMINPTWATNPLTTIFGGYVYIE